MLISVSYSDRLNHHLYSMLFNRVQGTFMRRTRNATPGDDFQPFYSQLQAYFSDPLKANRRLKDHPLTATFCPFLHDKVAETHDFNKRFTVVIRHPVGPCIWIGSSDKSVSRCQT